MASDRNKHTQKNVLWKAYLSGELADLLGCSSPCSCRRSNVMIKMPRGPMLGKSVGNSAWYWLEKTRAHSVVKI